MLKQEDYQVGSRTLIRTYTTLPNKKMICKEGTEERYFDQCFDIKPCPYNYYEDDMTEEEKEEHNPPEEPSEE